MILSKKRRLYITTLLIIAIGISVLFKLRWNAWFGNVPEEGYNTLEQIDRLTLTVGETFSSERTISWRYGETLKEATFEYALSPENLPEDSLDWHNVKVSGQEVQSRSGRGYYYAVRLNQLQAGGKYTYRIKQGLDSVRGIFTMPKALDSVTRFYYLGDIQDPSGAMSQSLFSRFNSENIMAEDIDFFALAGDQIEGPTDKFWNIWYNSWPQGLLSSVPFILATGNHEYIKHGFARELDSRWVHQYNYPSNGPKGFEGRSYYIDFPLMRFIVIDSNGINTPVDIWQSRKWLKDCLTESQQPWQIVMFHHAVRSVRAGRNNPIMRYLFKPILEDYGADLVLQGHDHAYSRILSKGDAGRLQTPVYIISSSSPKVYRNTFDEVHDKLGSGLQLYQSIEVRPHLINYRSHLYTGELYDEVVIRHSADKHIAHTVDDLGQNIPERFEFNAFGNSEKARKKERTYREAARERLRNKTNAEMNE